MVGLAVEAVRGGPGSCHNGSVLAIWFIHWEAEKASGLAGWRGGRGGAAVAGLGLPQREPAKSLVSSRVQIWPGPTYHRQEKYAEAKLFLELDHSSICSAAATLIVANLGSASDDYGFACSITPRLTGSRVTVECLSTRMVR